MKKDELLSDIRRVEILEGNNKLDFRAKITTYVLKGKLLYQFEYKNIPFAVV